MCVEDSVHQLPDLATWLQQRYKVLSDVHQDGRDCDMTEIITDRISEMKAHCCNGGDMMIHVHVHADE